MNAEMDNTTRFTDRVEYYAAFRPTYADAVVDGLRDDAGLAPDAVVVDIGSGTGISSDLFLRRGHVVYGVEPNAGMRRAAEQALRRYPEFHSIDATAEHTRLPDACADVVATASAFHWFDPVLARAEFRRLLRPGGLVIVMGNGRRKGGSLFMRAYDELIREFSVLTSAHENREERVRAFVGDGMRTMRIDYTEWLDFRALSGRTLSYSTMPLPGQPGHDTMTRELRVLFDAAADGSSVEYEGQVRVYWNRWP
jgi:SAM-dependent methyltransferase